MADSHQDKQLERELAQKTTLKPKEVKIDQDLMTMILQTVLIIFEDIKQKIPPSLKKQQLE